MSEAGTVFGMSVDYAVIRNKLGAAVISTLALQTRVVDGNGDDCPVDCSWRTAIAPPQSMGRSVGYLAIVPVDETPDPEQIRSYLITRLTDALDRQHTTSPTKHSAWTQCSRPSSHHADSSSRMSSSPIWSSTHTAPCSAMTANWRSSSRISSRTPGL